MKVLILEPSEQISKIYKKLFDKKQIESEFAKNELEFVDKFSENYDYYILEFQNTSKDFFSRDSIKNTNKKFLDLSPYIKNYEQIPNLSQETIEMLEKPFAMVTLLSKLEMNFIKEEIIA